MRSLLIVLCLLQTVLGAEIRGLNPQRKASYNPGRDFTCLDGSATIPFKLVNDDYCDCKDGSDEPGTAACSNGRFYCENRGHASSEVLSSRVNDGICDCCDGSDEYDSNARCTNNCVEMGKKAVEEQKLLQELHEQGYVKRMEYSTQGRQKIEQSRSEMADKEAEIQTLNAELETLKAAKEAAELPEREAKEKHNEAWEAIKEERKKERRIADAKVGFDELDTNSNGYVSVEEIQARDELDDDGDGSVSEAEALEYLDNSREMDFDSFLDSVWDLVSDKCQFKKVENEPVLPTPVPEEGEEDPDDYDDDDYDDDENEEVDPYDEQMPEYDEETKLLIAAADEARNAYSTADQRKRDLEADISRLGKFIKMDFGVDFEFTNLYDNCYEFTDLEYTYRMCAFGKVSQKSKSGGRETNLGNWGSWTAGKNYLEMKYENGEKCWNGPSRSATITLKCGLEDELLSASEPNRCEYAMSFSTPAVCEQVKHNNTHTEL